MALTVLYVPCSLDSELRAEPQGLAQHWDVEIEFSIENPLVRIHFIIVMIRWTGLAPWEFEFPFPGSLTSTFLMAALGRGADDHEAGERAHHGAEEPPPQVQSEM